MPACRLNLKVLWLLGFCSLLVISASHGNQQQALADAVNAYTQLKPITTPAELTLQQAEEVQRLLVLTLRPEYGDVVGYKAGLTSRAAQQQFSVSEPVTGVFFENMFTSTGSTIDSSTGVRLLLEADLLVRVKDETFNKATNHPQALAGLSQVIPFLEIPDIMFGKDVPLSGASIVSINVGSRYGVMGSPVDLADLDDAIERLASFTVVMKNELDEEIGVGKGQALMGHPLTAALWLRDSLKRQGITLKPGDLLSLGGMTRPMPLAGLKRVKAVYSGLAQQPVTINIGVR
ncbi:MAG: 2-keto-4-pentenoate hydratase [Parasphingorhabdus sp.]|jgi:2-keto-4-pentenoate hydratase